MGALPGCHRCGEQPATQLVLIAAPYKQEAGLSPSPPHLSFHQPTSRPHGTTVLFLFLLLHPPAVLPLCRHTQKTYRVTGPSAGRSTRAKYDAAAAHSGRFYRPLLTYFFSSGVSISGHSCFCSVPFRKRAVREL